LGGGKGLCFSIKCFVRLRDFFVPTAFAVYLITFEVKIVVVTYDVILTVW